MLDQTPHGHSTDINPAMAAAFAKADAEKKAKLLNRSEKLKRKTGFYDGRPVDTAALNEALAKASPIRPNCPVLTPQILKDYLKRALPTKQLTDDFTIISEMSKYILSQFQWEKNRDLDQKRVKRWESFMIEDAWNLDGSPIKFNDEDELHNGRHRLTASANCGHPFATNIRFGVPKATFRTEDTGKEWAKQDVFKHEGWKYFKLIPHMVRAIRYYLDNDFDSRDTNVSNDARLTEARLLGKRKLEKCAENATAISRSLTSKKRKEDEQWSIRSQYFGQANYIAAEIDAEDADEWFKKWATKPSLIQKIAVELMHSAPGQGHDTICRAIPILAWSLYRTHPHATAGEIRQALHWRRDCAPPKAV